jgi:hypothetical protein
MLGDLDPEHIRTSHAECQNRTIRMQMRRMTRLTDASTKKWRSFERRIRSTSPIGWHGRCRSVEEPEMPSRERTVYRLATGYSGWRNPAYCPEDSEQLEEGHSQEAAKHIALRLFSYRIQWKRRCRCVDSCPVDSGVSAIRSAFRCLQIKTAISGGNVRTQSVKNISRSLPEPALQPRLRAIARIVVIQVIHRPTRRRTRSSMQSPLPSRSSQMPSTEN